MVAPRYFAKLLALGSTMTGFPTCLAKSIAARVTESVRTPLGIVRQDDDIGIGHRESISIEYAALDFSGQR